MNKFFNITKLSGAVALALGFAAPAGAVVVVGGDNGWEISFDGNVNAFYTHIDADAGYFGTPAGGEDESRVTSGFLPAFFSFTAKSPTVNGLTGSARFSFAPTINDNNNAAGVRQKTNAFSGGGLQGSTIDTREVLANVEGNFGTVSYGRTLSIYGRQAILSDMTLFGVGFTFPNNAGVTAGRIGHGYVYPDFQTRFAYKTPSMNGFQAEIGMFDPAEDTSSVGGVTFNETDTPRFEGELTYATAFSGGTFKAWVDGQWQELSQTGGALEADVYGFGVGANVTFGGFGLTGYYYDGEGMGQLFSYSGAGIGCSGTTCEEADNDGFYVQGTYTFNGVTKVGVSYGESNQDAYGNAAIRTAAAQVDDASNKMYTVGIYHDVTSWLKVIGEYSHLEQEQFGGADPEADVFSVGSFVTW